jgi:hypothetical protein
MTECVVTGKARFVHVPLAVLQQSLTQTKSGSPQVCKQWRVHCDM